MEQQNNPATLSDSAGVLPMDNGASYNGVHDENPSSITSTGLKKGRGRPPKSPAKPKAVISTGLPKRGRGRPSKTGETSSAAKAAVVVKANIEEASTSADENKKKRGRPSKSSTANEQTNVISKPQVHVTPTAPSQEKVDSDEPAKRKRGRPSGTSPKKVAVASKSSTSKGASGERKRGRPSGSGSAKKADVKAKISTTNNEAARKRGRPKKITGSESATAPTTSSNESGVTAPSNI